MEYCEGFKNWLKCLKCEHICTSKCPLEKAALMQVGIWRPKAETEADLKPLER